MVWVVGDSSVIFENNRGGCQFSQSCIESLGRPMNDSLFWPEDVLVVDGIESSVGMGAGYSFIQLVTVLTII